MFKADGTPIWNPSAFVAKIDSYEGGLFTSDGQEIRNPVRFLATLEKREQQWEPPSKKRKKGDGKAPPQGKGDAAQVFKRNGDPVWNPEAFIAKIEHYEGGLFTSDGEEIRNPKAFLAGLNRSAGGGAGAGAAGGPALVRSDGSPVWNPRAFIAKIDNYKGGRYTASGEEIRNPQAFLDSLEGRGAVEEPKVTIYKANGEPIWNPGRFVEKIESYQGGLYTADWEEIRNPQAFLAGLQRGSSGRGRAGGGKSGKGKGGGETALMYKSDGTAIWNPEAFVAKISEYGGGLYTAGGEEIRNPQAFVAGLGKKGGGGK